MAELWEGDKKKDERKVFFVLTLKMKVNNVDSMAIVCASCCGQWSTLQRLDFINSEQCQSKK